MGGELNFEAMPFEAYEALASEQSGFELEEEFGRRSGRGGSQRPSRGMAKRSQRPSISRLGGPKKPPDRPPWFPPVRPRWPRGAVFGPYGVAEPYGAAPEPYPAEPVPAGSEYIRWVQSALNDVLGLRLPVHGVADPATRSAIRSFQRREGLPVDGVVGPDTERALLAARSGTSARIGPTSPVGPDMAQYSEPAPTAPAQELSFQWETLDGAFEVGRPPPKTRAARTTSFRSVKDFYGPASECARALKRAGKTRAEALGIINAQIGVAIAMLRKAATDLKRGSRSPKTKALFQKIFRVRPEFVPTWLKQTETIKDRGDVVATRCKRVADLLASGRLKFFCAINSTNCPDCGNDSSAVACSSYGKNLVVCLGDPFWDYMKNGNTDSLLAILMHEPFHIYYGVYVTEHRPDAGRFGGIYCIVQFVFETNNVVAPDWSNKRCAEMKVRHELGPFLS